MRTLSVIVAGLLCWLGAAPRAQAQPDPCAGWTMRTVVSGLGALENLEPDRSGGMFVSNSSTNEIQRVTPDGRVTTFAPADRPGGLRVRDGHLYANTGNGAASGLQGTADGTLSRFDLETGAAEIVASGLVVPNGLVFDPSGNAYVSRDLPPLGTSITRITPDGNVESWADLADTNGLAVDPGGTWLYVTTTFNLPSTVYRIRLDDPTIIEPIADLFGVGGSLVPKGLDDLTIDAEGILYITANSGGEVIRLDPATGEACVVMGGMLLPSAVKFGSGPGWPADRLYVTGFDGALRELVPASSEARPPPGVGTPAPEPPATGARPDLPTSGGGVVLGGVFLIAAASQTRKRPGPRPRVRSSLLVGGEGLEPPTSAV